MQAAVAGLIRSGYLIHFVDTQEAVMNAQVRKWGNSLAVRIPGPFAKELELEEGSEVEMTRVEDGLLLRPRKREYTLAELLGQIRPEQIHGETDWGPSVGRESW